ncbi:MFS transporter [Sphaerimonospora cavernae]|uniref:MFS transporter n=1 Tax=Sphaerimonospora cavernae TaxID=1740611 RepID=A0ABV6U601_9ACTN
MEANTEAGSAVRAGAREWLGLAVLALPTLLLSLDMSVLYLALPHLGGELGATGTQQLWITDIYGFFIAGFLVTMGTLGDRIGRRRLLLIGAAAFAAASVMAAYATSPEMLIVARALLGIAGATQMPSTMALLATMFRDPRQMGTAIAVWMSCFMGGMALGPVIGGVLLQSFWWGSVFLLAVPVMGLLLIAGPILLPEYRDTGAARLDMTSVALSLGTILPLIYGLKELARSGWQASSVVAIAAGAVIGVIFVRRQHRLADPLLDLGLFRHRTFSAALVIMLLGGVANGSYLLVSIFLQTVEGLTPLQAGLLLLPSTAATIGSVLLAPMLGRRFRPAHIMASGLVLTTVGYLMLTQVDGSSGLAVVVTGLIVAATGLGPMGALGNGLVLGSVPAEKTGAASAISETSGEFGIALGVAALGSVGTAVYQGGIDVPSGLPAAAADSARESIVGAVTVADQLPQDLGSQLLDAAYRAFSTAVNSAAAVSALIVLGLSVLTIVTLRHVPPTGSPEAGQDEISQNETAQDEAGQDGGADGLPAPSSGAVPA